MSSQDGSQRESAMAASHHSRKRAQRVQLACDPCRIGKLKCDRNLPVCDQCYKRSRESACRYTERGLRYNTARHKADTMREKIDRLETFVNRMKNSRAEGAHADGSWQNGHGDDIDDLEHLTEPDLLPLTGKLNLSPSGTRYVGGAHWESIIDDIADVKAYFELESANSPGYDEPLEETYTGPSLPSNTILGCGQSLSKRELLQQLPPKTEMDKLVATWFNAYDPIRLIIHAPTFQKQYQTFWSRPNEISPAWLSLLYAVGAAGAQMSGQGRRDGATLMLAEELRRLTVHALVLADSVFPKPFVIEALMFYEKSLLLKSHDTMPRAWQVHGQVMRLCFHAGYHRDPANNRNISPFDCEMRRRVWMIAVEYDILCSYQAGLSSLLNPKLCDTEFPSNLLDSDFSTDNVPLPRSRDDYTLTQGGIFHGRLVAIFGDVILSSHAIAPASRADIAALQARLDEARDTLPETLKFRPTDQSFMDSPGQILDRYRMECVYQKAICVLYRRFLNQPGCEAEHEKCIAAAEVMLHTLVPLLEAVQDGGQMSACLVFIYRHIHDFNLAAMLLCAELKRLWSENSALAGDDDDDDDVDGRNKDAGFIARIRPALLAACSLWLSSGVVSPTARQAVRAIEKFITQGGNSPVASSAQIQTQSNTQQTQAQTHVQSRPQTQVFASEPTEVAGTSAAANGGVAVTSSSTRSRYDSLAGMRSDMAFPGPIPTAAASHNVAPPSSSSSSSRPQHFYPTTAPTTTADAVAANMAPSASSMSTGTTNNFSPPSLSMDSGGMSPFMETSPHNGTAASTSASSSNFPASASSYSDFSGNGSNNNWYPTTTAAMNGNGYAVGAGYGYGGGNGAVNGFGGLPVSAAAGGGGMGVGVSAGLDMMGLERDPLFFDIFGTQLMNQGAVASDKDQRLWGPGMGSGTYWG